MKLTILGSGTTIQTKRRSSSAYLLEGTKIHLLIDCGPGTIRRLLEDGFGVGGINHVLITHTHPDHIFDLVPLLHAKFVWEMYSKEMRIEPPLNEYPIDVVGPPGFAKIIQMMANASDPSLLDKSRVPGFDVKFTEVVNTDFTRGDLFIRSGQTEVGESYIPPSVAYLVLGGGKSILFTGDVRRTEEIITLGTGVIQNQPLNGIDVLVIDCRNPVELPPGGHLNPPLVAQAAQKMKARRVILTHLDDFVVERADLVKEVKSAFDGGVELAHDGLTLEL